MKIPRVALIALLVLHSFPAIGAAPTKTQLETMYDKAFREFDANHYDEALKALDAIDALQPNLAESENLRGVVLMRKGEYNKAEAALRKALEIEPKFWNASFNLSEIPFLKKDWAEARNRFEALVAGNSEEMKGETSRLIQYKILLTFVLQGKENMVDWIVNKFEDEKESPALYYSNAAIALHRNNQKEAKEWMDAADKHYPASLNKLFAESLYEVGWLTKPAGETRAAIEITSTSERATRLKADAQANFERAERSFQQRDFPAALKFLDLADEGAPGQAASLNLRGEIFMEDKKLDEAEEAFHEAFTADPKFREAQYNLAQVPFKKKDYAKSRERLEALFAETPGGEKNQAAQLIKYKIFMTLLLEGNDVQAQKMMDQFKFTGDTPALYYAQAAWAFKHDNPDQGNDWIKSARKIYSPALNIVFADTFYDLSWLQRAPDTVPPTTALAQADAAEPGPSPSMRFGGADSVPAPVVTGDGEATAAPASAKPAVVAQASPAAAPNGSPVQAVAKNAGGPVRKASVPATVTASSAVTPAATAMTPARIREWSRPTFAEMMDRARDPRTLLFGGLLLGGVVILGWLVVQQTRRHTSGASLYEPSMPLAEPRFSGSEPIAGDERRVSREHLEGGPPKLSLQLKGSEPAARRAMPASVAPGARHAFPDLNKPAIVLPNEPAAPVSKVTPAMASAGPPAAKTPKAPEFAGSPNESKTPPATPVIPLRDEKDVSLAVRPKRSVLPVAMRARPLAARNTAPDLNKPAVVLANEPAAPVSKVTPAMASAGPPAAETPKAPELAALPNEPKTLLATSMIPLRDEKDVSPADRPKRSVLPVSMRPRPLAAALPPIIAQPKAPVVELEKLAIPAEVKPPVVPIAEQPLAPREEPVGQGQPVPHLTSITPTPPLTPELTVLKPEPETKPDQVPIRIEPETAAIAAIAGAHAAPQSSVETPSFASKIITTKPTTPPSTTFVIMPESSITPISSDVRTSSPAMAVQQPAGGMHTAVQLTFSLEIASMQLTPTFKMSGLQLKPTSKVVSMRLAPSQQPQPPMNLQVTFEVASIQLSNGTIGTIRLAPSAQEKPAVLTSPSFAISGLELMTSAGRAPVQLTPSHQEQASVHLTAQFQIAAIEFSPLFEITAIVLNSTSKNVSMQLPGSGPSSIDGAPVFEIENVQLSGNSELGIIQVNPLGASGRRA